MWIGRGSVTAAPAHAANTAATRYWPSTPMLNRFIRKPTLTASPARNSGMLRLIQARIWFDCARGVSPKLNRAATASTGSTSRIVSTIARMTSAARTATTADSTDSSSRRVRSLIAATSRPPGTLPRSRRLLVGLVVGAGHVRAEHLGSHLGRVEPGDDLAAQQHVQRVREADQL